MGQKENQGLQEEWNFALRGAHLPAAALGADVCGTRIDVAAGTELDVVSLAAVVAVGRSACCHSSAAKAKFHDVLSKSESLVSPSGLSQTADQKPSRLICSRVVNQKIFRVCFAIVCWIVLSLRSEGTTTSTRNCS